MNYLFLAGRHGMTQLYLRVAVFLSSLRDACKRGRSLHGVAGFHDKSCDEHMLNRNSVSVLFPIFPGGHGRGLLLQNAKPGITRARDDSESEKAMDCHGWIISGQNPPDVLVFTTWIISSRIKNILLLLPEPPPRQLSTPADVYMDLLTPLPLGF